MECLLFPLKGFPANCRLCRVVQKIFFYILIAFFFFERRTLCVAVWSHPGSPCFSLLSAGIIGVRPLSCLAKPLVLPNDSQDCFCGGFSLDIGKQGD